MTTAGNTPRPGRQEPADRLYTDIGETLRAWNPSRPFTESGNEARPAREPAIRDLQARRESAIRTLRAMRESR